MLTPRMTPSTLAVLRTFLEDPEAPRYGLQICQQSGHKSGTVYPVLDRLEEAGWLVAEWEEVRPQDSGRPRRRLYRLTPLGLARATNAATEAAKQIIPLAWAPTWNPGRA